MPGSTRGGPPPTIDPDEAREAARDILGRPEYAEPEPGVVERAVEWVFERAGSVLGTLTGGGPGQVIAWVVVVGGLAFAAWLMARALRVPGVARHLTDDAVRYGSDTRRDPAAWREEADRLAAAGDTRGALRCHYQAMVAEMVLSGVLDDVPGLTSGDHRRQLRARRPSAGTAIDRVTDGFERTWYGGEAVDAEDLSRFARACQTIEVPDDAEVGA